jgi:rSAM/selenodomain-associated transferase 2
VNLSIVIPTLNEASHIEQAIDRAWQLSPAEVIVVDGGSTDATLEICRRLRCEVLETQPGRGTQLNAGARQARGDVLLFLHADCWLDPAAASQIAAVLNDANVQAGAFQQRIEAKARIYRWIERGNAWRVRRRGVAFGDQAIFIRRELFNQLGGFPETPIMEDLVLMKRVRRLTKPALLDGPVHISARRWQQRGVVRQTLRNWLLQLAHAAGVPANRLARHYLPDESDAIVSAPLPSESMHGPS